MNCWNKRSDNDGKQMNDDKNGQFYLSYTRLASNCVE